MITNPAPTDPAPANHVHIETHSRDCDGPHESSRIEPDTNLIRYFDLYDLGVGQQQVTIDVVDGLYEVEIAAPTEEGYRNTTLRECASDCDLTTRHYRDVFAEQAGY